MNIKNLVEWARQKSKSKGTNLNHKMLNIFLFYAKGFFYVFENDSLFVENIKVKNSLPYVEFMEFETSHEYIEELNQETKNILEFVFDNIFKFDENTILMFAKSDLQKINTNKDGVINEQDFCTKFRSQYLTDEQNNNFKITRSQIVDMMSKNVFTKYNKAFKKLAE